MKKILLQPTVTAEWQALVQEAEAYRSLSLGEDLQSYLVFLLTRYTDKPECVSAVLGLEFLESQQCAGQIRVGCLRDIADKCLIFSGLFPKQVEKRRVPLSYIVNVGQCAFDALSEKRVTELYQLYAACRDGFLLMMDIMHAMRELDSHVYTVDPLEAASIEAEVARGQRDVFLKRYTDGAFISPSPKNPRH